MKINLIQSESIIKANYKINDEKLFEIFTYSLGKNLKYFEYNEYKNIKKLLENNKKIKNKHNICKLIYQNDIDNI